MKNLYRLFLIALPLFVCSCSDFLDEKVYTQITNEYLISTPEGMAATVNAIYNRERNIIRNGNDTESTLWTTLVRGTDITLARAGDGSDQFGRYTNLLPTNGTVSSFWNHHYRIIGYANIVVDAFNKVDQSSEIAIKAAAEARVFRAHAYFWLLRKFDRIFLTTRVTTPENVNDPIDYHPADPKDVYALINEDLDFAIKYLQWRDEPGRMNQAVARHIKADVAMWQQNYTEAVNQTEEIFNSNQYELVGLDEIFGNADLDHKESLLLYCWSKELGGSAGVSKPSGHRMSLHFLPRYEKQKGLLRTQENGGYTWGRTYPNDYLFRLYDQNSDRRFTSFYKHTWNYNNPDDLPNGKQLGDIVTTTSKASYLEQLHPGCTKFIDKWTRLVDETESFKDIIVYRLAQTYLTAAEANLKTGNMDKAREYYNKTWMRAGNPEFTGEITMDMIIDEQARELAMEGHRWFFLKRLGILVERVQLNGGEKTSMVLDIRVRDAIKPHHVRWPIPQAEIDNMGKDNFPQNDGY